MGLMLLSTLSTASNIASTSASPCDTVGQRSPRETWAQLKKRHTYAEISRDKSQKEQIQPGPRTYAEQASVKHSLSNTPGPSAGLLQLSSYKRNSLWLGRKTKLLGVSKIGNAPPSLSARRDIMPKSPAPVLRIGSPMLLLPKDAQRRRSIHRRSVGQGPWQHPVVDSNFACASSVPDIDKPGPISPPKRISHRRSSRSTSIATSFSMYSQSSCAQPLQRPVSKVAEETKLDVDKVEDANRDSMTPSAESGWTVASYHSTAQCVWKDTQWDFVSPPTGSQEGVYFLESEDEQEDVVSSESFEVTLPYLDSNSTTPTSTGGATYCADSSTPTLTLAGLQPPSKDDKRRKRHYDKEEERASLLCVDYDYTAAIDQIVYGDHVDDDASSLELGRIPVSGPASSYAAEQERRTFRPGHRARSSHSSYQTISHRLSSSKRGHHLSTNSRKEFVVEKGTHIPAAIILRHRSLSKTRRSSLRAGATRKSPRPAMPGGFNLEAALLPKPAPAPAMVSSPSSTEVEALKVVTHQAPGAQTKASRVHTGAEGRFGRLGGRGDDSPKFPALKSKQKKSIFFNVLNFFAKG